MVPLETLTSISLVKYQILIPAWIKSEVPKQNMSPFCCPELAWSRVLCHLFLYRQIETDDGSGSSGWYCAPPS